jgi:hypothetical protein
MQIDTNDLFQYLEPETLKRVLGDIADNREPDDAMADKIRNAALEFAAGPCWTDDDRVRFMLAPGGTPYLFGS